MSADEVVRHSVKRERKHQGVQEDDCLKERRLRLRSLICGK